MIEVSDELLYLLGVGKVVAPWEDVRDPAGLLFKAVEPQVSAQADFRGKFSVAGEVVVDLVGFEVGGSTLQVANVEANVEVLLRVLLLWYLLPA